MQKNEKLRLARLRIGLSQVQLAEKLGFKQAYISKLEKGESFSEDQARKIAEVLAVEWQEIFPDASENISYISNSNTEDPSIIESLKEVIRSKDETIHTLRDRIEDLKARLTMYEEKPKTGTN